jgi:lipoprotein-anchoring transpeptidase ErfK/SrfK
VLAGAVVLVGAAVGGTVAATSGSSASGHSTTATTSRTGSVATAAATTTTLPTAAEITALADSVTFNPPTGSSGVALDAPVQVSTATGHLESVVVTGPDGTPVSGTAGANGTQWTSDAPLAAGSTYHVAATVRSPAGWTTQTASSFTTLTPQKTVVNTLFPEDGLTVGVGQPVVVRFSRSITTAAAQAAALPHFTITMSQPVAGGWHWFSPTELHFRPQSFWPPGEQVTVTSDLSGWDAGNGIWGKGQVSVHFSIGDSHVAIANLTTEQMTVTDNGKVIATYPFSGGRSQYPTMNGIHIALDRESVVHMVSSTVGIPVNSPNGYDEYVYEDVHISDSGEYVHAAPWSVGAQGFENVSHGCVNLSTANATTFFNFSRVGDVVEVIDGSRPPVTGDHGVMDWSTDWSQWTPAVVTSSTPAVAAPTPATVATTATTATTVASGSPTAPSGGQATSAVSSSAAIPEESTTSVAAPTSATGTAPPGSG